MAAIASGLYECSTVVLGSGSFSHVYKGKRSSDGIPVAIKIFNPKVLPQAAREECELCQHLMRLNIAGIVKFFHVACDVSVPTFEIVMENLTGGELFERIVNKGIRSEAHAASIIYNLIDTMSQLHHVANVIHADIKPENIVFIDDKDDSPFRLIDFGLSIHTSAHNVKNGLVMKELVGTFGYMAPETYFDRVYSESADMWSLGVILYVLLSGSMPFDVDSKNFVKKLKIGQYYSIYTDIWAKISGDAKDLVKRLLVADPKLRLTSTDALMHPWFKTYGLDSNKNCSSIRTSTVLSEEDNTFNTQYISRLKAISAKQRVRKVINGVIWTNRLQRCLLSKTLMSAAASSDDLVNLNISESENAPPISSGGSIMKSSVSVLTGQVPTRNSESLNQTGGSQENISNTQSHRIVECDVISDAKLPSREISTRRQSVKEDSSPSNIKPTCMPSISERKLSLSLTTCKSYKEGISNDILAANQCLDGVISAPPLVSLVSIHSKEKKAGSKSPNFRRSFMPEVHQIQTEELVCLATEDIYRFKSIFEAIINDSTVSIVNFDQFSQACINIGLGLLAKADIFELFDSGSSGYIEYREFLVALCVFQEVSDSSLRLYFDLFDKNNDGSLSVEEFQFVLGSCLSFLESTNHLNLANTGDNLGEIVDSTTTSSIDDGRGVCLDSSSPCSSPLKVVDRSEEKEEYSQSFKWRGNGFKGGDREDSSSAQAGQFRDMYSVFSEMDSNKDGCVDFEEFSRWMKINFESVCQNFRFNVRVTE